MSIISLTLPFSFLASSFESPLSTTGISSKNKFMCAYNNQLYIGIEYTDFIEEFNKEKITFALIIKGEEIIVKQIMFFLFHTRQTLLIRI